MRCAHVLLSVCTTPRKSTPLRTAMDDDTDLLLYTDFLETFDSFSESPALPLSSDASSSFVVGLNGHESCCYTTETPIETPSKQPAQSE